MQVNMTATSGGFRTLTNTQTGNFKPVEYLVGTSKTKKVSTLSDAVICYCFSSRLIDLDVYLS